MKQFARMQAMVITDPEIMGGTPVFKGTRIPVELVAEMLAQGASAGKILEGTPHWMNRRSLPHHFTCARFRGADGRADAPGGARRREEGSPFR